MNDSTRIPVSIEAMTEAANRIRTQLGKRLEKHGPLSYASTHETYGIVAEEVDELLEAIRLKEPERTARVESELEDIAVAAMFGLASSIERRRTQ